MFDERGTEKDPRGTEPDQRQAERRKIAPVGDGWEGLVLSTDEALSLITGECVPVEGGPKVILEDAADARQTIRNYFRGINIASGTQKGRRLSPPSVGSAVPPIAAVELPEDVSPIAPMRWVVIEEGWWGLYIESWPNPGSWGCAAVSLYPCAIKVRIMGSDCYINAPISKEEA